MVGGDLFTFNLYSLIYVFIFNIYIHPVQFCGSLLKIKLLFIYTYKHNVFYFDKTYQKKIYQAYGWTFINKLVFYF